MDIKPTIALIGGTGFDALNGVEEIDRIRIETPYGTPSDSLSVLQLKQTHAIFLPRHGQTHQLPPHKINYRANIWALKEYGVKQVIALAAVGSIHPEMTPGRLVLPDQILDYTYGREHTYSDGTGILDHIDFTDPYDENLRQRLIAACVNGNIEIIKGGTYAATQGPRLESAAEINRLEQDGADMVGMTGMPECALARELGLAYATVAIVVNEAAGRSQGPITMDLIRSHLKTGVSQIQKMIACLQ